MPVPLIKSLQEKSQSHIDLLKTLCSWGFMITCCNKFCCDTLCHFYLNYSHYGITWWRGYIELWLVWVSKWAWCLNLSWFEFVQMSALLHDKGFEREREKERRMTGHMPAPHGLKGWWTHCELHNSSKVWFYVLVVNMGKVCILTWLNFTMTFQSLIWQSNPPSPSYCLFYKVICADLKQNLIRWSYLPAHNQANKPTIARDQLLHSSLNTGAVGCFFYAK